MNLEAGWDGVDVIHLVIIYIIFSTTNVYLLAFIEQGCRSLKFCLLQPG
jgi:hypothetical protein